MQLGYYPGCALEGSSKDYSMAVERVMKELGVELVPVNDWNCCGASAAHSTNHKLSLALPYRNLVLAKEQGLAELFAPCPFCSKTLINTNSVVSLASDVRRQEMQNAGPKTQDALTAITELKYDGSVKIINSVDIFTRLMDKILPKVNPLIPPLEKGGKGGLNGLKVACYYGCLLVRPPKILKYDNPEHPITMDNLVKKLGADPVDWEFKTECCGGGFTICNEDAVLELGNKILEDAKENGAQAIIVACQMCQINLDMRQKAIEKKYGVTYQMPIIYLPQLIGLAMGIEPKELGLGLHFVDTSSVISRASGVVGQDAKRITHNA